MTNDSLDIAALRADTPAVARLIHFNNAGASLMPRPVLDALTGHLTLEAEIGGYEAREREDAKLERFYDAAARMVGGERDEIAFIENATRAWDMVFYAFDWKAGDRLITSRADYDSNMIAYLQVARKYGVSVELVPDDDHGQLDPNALEAMLDERVKLISISHVPTNSGLVSPVSAVGAIARKHGVPFLLDACQSVGQMPIDVQEIGCTMLSTTGRKYIRGPRGAGFLWVRRDWIERLEPPFLDNHAATWTAVDDYRVRDDARRFENWECYFAGKIGLGVALDYAWEIGVDASWRRTRGLAEMLRGALDALPGVAVQDPGAERCGIVTFSSPRPADELKQAFRAKGVNTSVSVTQLTRQELLSSGVEKTTRASVHYFNTEDEIDRFIETLKTLL